MEALHHEKKKKERKEMLFPSPFLFPLIMYRHTLDGKRARRTPPLYQPTI